MKFSLFLFILLSNSFTFAQGIYSDDAIVICDVPAKDWPKVQEVGYLEVSFESKDPFIHCARPSQFFYVMNKYFKGDTWVVLVTHADKVNDILKYENDYPHLYGKLELKNVFHTLMVSPDENGHYELPSVFAKNQIKLGCETVRVDSCVGNTQWNCHEAYEVVCSTKAGRAGTKEEAQKLLKRVDRYLIKF